jgi:hypothetical protein
MLYEEFEKQLDELIRQARALELATDKLIRQQKMRREKLYKDLLTIWI